MEQDKEEELDRQIEEEKKHHKKPAIKGSKRFILGILGFLLLAGGGLGVFYFSRPYEKTKEYVDLSYDIVSDSSYVVKLKENTLYDTEELPEGRLYPTKLTDNIIIDFKTDFKSNRTVEISGTYDLTAVIEGYQMKGEVKKIIYDKTLAIKNIQISNQNRKELEINEKILVNPEEYRAYAEAAELIIGSGISREMTLLFEAVLNVNGEEEKIRYSFPVFIGNDNVYDVVKSEPVNIHKEIKDITTVLSIPSTLSYLPFGIIGGLGFIILIAVSFVYRSKNDDELWEDELRGLVRKYGSRMIEIENYPNEEDWAILVVQDILSMIELSEELRRPVLYNLASNGLPRNGVFYILGTDYMYIYQHARAENNKKGENKNSENNDETR